MKILRLFLSSVFLIFLSRGEAQVLPSPVQHISRFELRGEAGTDWGGSPWYLDEHIIIGNRATVFLSISGLRKVFLMEPPKVDSCGVSHFKGKSLIIEQGTESSREYEVVSRGFHEIDVSCWSVPFERCGAFKPAFSSRVGAYLLQELSRPRSECWVQVRLPGEKPQILQILLPSQLHKD